MSTPREFGRDLVVSIKPIYADKIINGTKTVELRRRFSKTVTAGTIALIYSSSPVQAIVGYVHIKGVERLPVTEIWQHHGQEACINREDFFRYFSGLNFGYAILLGGVRKFDRQIEVSDLQKKFGFVPPQSFRYVDKEYNSLLQDGQPQAPH